MKKYILFLLVICLSLQAQEWQIDLTEEWHNQTASIENVDTLQATDWGGVIDLMGDGALILEKVDNESLYTRVSEFHSSGQWVSKWYDPGSATTFNSIETSLIGYGKPLDMTKGWIKFSGNPVLSGSNTLLPLNPENITDQTILLPDPGGVPQDQSVVRGCGVWEGKWVLFFNHTPDRWPNDYYWSAAVADYLYPLKKGINPFKIDMTYYPLYGPIDNHGLNDWLEVDSVTYAPDENYKGDSHMWKSVDMLNWIDMGPITGINGSDPGMTYDGRYFYLFNEGGNVLNYNRLSEDFTHIADGATVLNVDDHTGDADVAFFNNQWHMFFDDGPHLHYNIGHASSSPDDFPLGWTKENDIYGPHNPEQGQRWDDDTKEGNDFGTGDADIALEGTTLYMFTERPVGVAYKELTELFNGDGLEVQVLIEADNNGDSIADDSTGWQKMAFGKSVWIWPKSLTGNQFRVSFKLMTDVPTESPLIEYFRLSGDVIHPEKLKMESDIRSMLNFRDTMATISCQLLDAQDRLTTGTGSKVFFSLIGNGQLIGTNPVNPIILSKE